MPKFIARLEATDGSGHFRRTYIHSANIDEAREAVLRNEQKLADHRLTTAELDRIAYRALGEASEKERAAFLRKVIEDGPGDIGKKNPAAWDLLQASDRMQIVMHRQAEPYQLVYLNEEEPPRDPARRKVGA